MSSSENFRVPNHKLDHVEVDHLYHLGLNSGMDLKGMFGDVKFICMGGSANRMELFARKIQKVLDIKLPVGTDLVPIGKTERYSMYKVGPVISVNHGMGQPSLSILLHELAKLLMYAETKDVVLIRIGTSGGIGCPPGTVVVTEEALDGQLRAQHDEVILGKVVSRPTKFDIELCKRVLATSGDIHTIIGKTICADDFYEGQGRTDGAICDYTIEEKMDFLKQCHEKGVRNFEMECSVLSSFCNKVGLKCLDICCTLLDRLNGDQINATAETLAGYSHNAIQVACNFIESELKK